MLKFRPFRRADYSDLRGMMHRLSREDPSTERVTDRKISLTFRQLSNNPKRGRIIIFEEATAIIGYAVLIFYWSNEYGGNILHIDELYVKPEHRGRGVATSFFKKILGMKHSVVAFELEVTPANTRAMNYYHKLGFKKSQNVHLIRTI